MHNPSRPAVVTGNRIASSLLALMSMLGLLVACNQSDTKREVSSSQQRIITLGGPITEIVYALGAGKMIVATDISSTFPDSATKLPQVGYQRTLSAENILALDPTLIIASDEAGPPPAIEQLKNSGVRVVIAPSKHSVEGVRAKIAAVADAIGRQAEGRILVDMLDADLVQTIPASTAQPRVLFIYTRGPGALQVSGSNTAADAMIALADARNAVDGYEGYKPLTPEAAIAAAPDVILLPARGLDQLGGVDALLKTPGIAETPAGEHRRIIAMDDLYLLGFGPRMGKARHELARRIHDMLTEESNGKQQ